MNKILSYGREIIIVVLALLLGVMSARNTNLETQQQYLKAVMAEHRTQTRTLQNQVSDMLAKTMAKLANKEQELKDWKESSSEEELKLVQEGIRINTELNAYKEEFGPLPLKIAPSRRTPPPPLPDMGPSPVSASDRRIAEIIETLRILEN